MAAKRALTFDVSVTGVKESLRVLKGIDEQLYWKSISEIKEAAGPIVKAMDANFPDEGPTGFQHAGRTGWGTIQPTVVQYGGRRSKSAARSGTWPLVRVKVIDAARQIFDMAGAENPGNKLDRGLQKGGYGAASRAVWRVSDEARKEANRALLKAMGDVTRSTNRKLGVIRGGGV